jgi:hypothetical protein
MMLGDMEYALIDCGTNGGIFGTDMLVLEGSKHFVDVVGLARHKVSQLHIVTAWALVSTHKGDAIATFHQMAFLGKGKSILSCLHMEAHGADINDRSKLVPGGKQRILIDRYQMPLDFKNGLPYLWCRKPTPGELESLPHIIMTSDVEWHPSQYDKDYDDFAAFYDPSEEDHEERHFDQYQEYWHHMAANHHICFDEEFYDACEFFEYEDQVNDLLDTVHPEIVSAIYRVNSSEISKFYSNFDLLRPLFGWTPANTIKCMFGVTIQYA